MVTHERPLSLSDTFSHGFLALVLASTFMLTGCDSNESQSQIARLDISPDSVSLAAGEHADFTVVALTAAGDTVADPSLRWWSTDPNVFTVENDGVATGQEAGTAFCNVEVIGRRFVGRDSAFVAVF